MRSRVLLLGLLLFALLGLSAAPALAQDAEQSVEVKLTTTDPDGEKVPIVGVSFVVSLDGDLVGEGVSNEEGIFLLPVDGVGEYTLAIDPNSLPEGVALRDPSVTERTAKVEAGRATGRAIFALESSEGIAFRESGETGGIRAVQLALDGAKLGLFLAMGAIGLSLIYGTTGLTNFAHSEMIVFGMMAAYFFNFYGLAGFMGFLASWPAPFGGGVNLILAGLLAMVCGGGLGWLLDAWLFRPMRKIGIGVYSQMIVTIGLSILLRYFLKYLFGGAPRFYKDYTAQTDISLGIASTTPKDLIAMAFSVIVLGGVGFALTRTRMGKAMRAVADNRDLAESSGIDVERVIRLVWIAGGALAALGGVLLGLSEVLNWLLGFRMLLLIFAGVTLGGLGTAYGALLGCLLVGIGIQVSTLIIPIELKNAGALLVMIVVLMLRPQGILGRASRIG